MASALSEKIEQSNVPEIESAFIFLRIWQCRCLRTISDELALHFASNQSPEFVREFTQRE